MIPLACLSYRLSLPSPNKWFSCKKFFHKNTNTQFFFFGSFYYFKVLVKHEVMNTQWRITKVIPLLPQ